MRYTLASGMVLAIISFMWAYPLNSGDQVWFALVCIASGAALGADMMLLPALFCRYQTKTSLNPAVAFGFWIFSGKASLALILPALSWSGFSVGSTKSPEALNALAFLYAIVPCILKTGALIMLFMVIKPDQTPQKIL
nr:hypothetical protein [Cohaesibacter gelatinilyticus]